MPLQALNLPCGTSSCGTAHHSIKHLPETDSKAENSKKNTNLACDNKQQRPQQQLSQSIKSAEELISTLGHLSLLLVHV